MYHLYTWNHWRKGHIKYCQIISVHPNSRHQQVNKTLARGLLKKNSPLIRWTMLRHCIFWHWKINLARELKRNFLCVSKFGEKTLPFRNIPRSVHREIFGYSQWIWHVLARISTASGQHTHMSVVVGGFRGEILNEILTLILLVEEILQQLRLVPLSHNLPGFSTSQVVKRLMSEPSTVTLPNGMVFHTGFWPLR